jgi:F-type H+-transporting ATPase subunit b
MLLSLDGTFAVQLVNFAIFFGLVYVLFMKPVREAIAKRRRYLDGLVSDYDDYAKQANALRGQAEARRAAARREADARLAAERALVAKEVEAIATEHAVRASKVIEAAQATVQRELAAAHSVEDRLVKELADEMLERAFAAEGAR